jgi:hypothetical protein
MAIAPRNYKLSLPGVAPGPAVRIGQGKEIEKNTASGLTNHRF